jgi:hypothetical protein
MTVAHNAARFALGFCICFCAAAVCVAQPNLTLDVSRYDFGILEPSPDHQGSIVLTNTGDVPLIVKSVSGTCGCIEVSALPKSILDPGEQMAVGFTFDASDYLGPVENFLYITTNDPDEGYRKVPVAADVRHDSDSIIERIAAMGPVTVMALGLIDSVNPCAVTVLVFFISFVTFVGYRRREMFLIGISFIAVVFVTYLLLGFGVLNVFKKLLYFEMASKMLSWSIAVFALFLGMVSLWDAWIYAKTKDPEKVALKLPGAVKHTIQQVIQETTDIREKRGYKPKRLLGILGSSVVCGFLVTLLESVCTGQAYVPTLLFILKMETMRSRALFYLVLYNLMFVLPLLVIMVVAIIELNSERFVSFTRTHLGVVKVVMGFSFFFLAAAILFSGPLTGTLKKLLPTVQKTSYNGVPPGLLPSSNA